VLWVCALSPAAAAAREPQQRIAGDVTRVRDGDTIDITSSGRVYTVRLEGIDAPEGGQPFGRAARLQLRVLALSRVVVATGSDVDRYGRLVARVTVGTTDLSEEMVRSGYAWHYAQYSRDVHLDALERQARAARRGLWSDQEPVAPWDYRRAHSGMPPRPTAAPGAGSRQPRTGPMPGPYHGNTSSRIYHAPGCRDYDCAHCTQPFMSRATAEAAGYRPHAACVTGK
jgi:micrococcal nuclease